MKPQTARVLPHPSVPAVAEPIELDEATAPNDLTLEERLIWLELGKLALSKGKTLSMIQAYPFRLLCSNVALERRYARSVLEAGGASHCRMIQTVDRELLRFGLVDFSKAAPAKPKPAVNPFSQLA